MLLHVIAPSAEEVTHMPTQPDGNTAAAVVRGPNGILPQRNPPTHSFPADG